MNRESIANRKTKRNVDDVSDTNINDEKTEISYSSKVMMSVPLFAELAFLQH
jgi:hypothetical protein